MLRRARSVAALCAAFLLAPAVVARAEGIAVEQATPKQSDAAQVAFARADRLFDVQRYEEALDAYRESYAIVASPNSLLMVARSLQELGRLDEAHHEYELTVTAAADLAKRQPTYEKTAAAAQHELEALKSRVAWLTIELGDVPVDSSVTVGGKPVAVEALSRPVVVLPGRVDVVATGPDGRVARAEVHLAAGRESTVTLRLDETVTVGEPPPSAAEARVAPEPRPKPDPRLEPTGREPRFRAAAIATTAVGGAGIVTFTVLGAMARSRYEDLDAACPDGLCPSERADDIDAGRRTQTAANIALAVGVVGASTGVTLFVVGRGRGEAPASASVGLVPGGVTVRGRFR